MANKILNLIFKATDKATPTLDNLQGAEGKGGIGGISSALKGMINPATMAMGAVAGLGVAVSKSITDWRTYTQEVGDFNAMIDGTIEETSVLIDISKRYSITMDTMLAAMRSMANSGLEPNIEGLISLRETLDNTSSASERLALAQRMIGEQGIKQILPMLEQLTDEELRNYIDTMEEGNIVTEEQLALSREMEMAIADLDSMWKGFTRGLMTDTVPVLNDILYLITATAEVDSADWVNEMAEAAIPAGYYLGLMADAIHDIRVFLEGLEPEVKDSTVYIGEMALVTNQLRDASTEAAAAIDGLTESQAWALGIAALEEGRTDQAAKYFNEAAAINAKADAYRNLRSAWSGGQGIGAAIAATGNAGADWRTWTGPAGAPSSASTAPSSIGGTVYYDGQTYNDAYWDGSALIVRGQVALYRPGYAFGGEFTIGGFGGTDSTPVSFMGTPGEKVKVGDSDDMSLLVLEVRRLVNQLPIIMRDAVERVI